MVNTPVCGCTKLLLNCRWQESITKQKFEHSSFVADKALQYLNLVNDYQQYLAARCAMGENVYMYERYAASEATL